MTHTLALPAHSVTSANVVHHAAALALLNALPSGSVDMALLDLPYGTTACAWDEIIPFAPMWAGLKRVCKKGAAMVFTASQPFTTALIASNIDSFRYEWIWQKSNGGGFLNANRQPLKRHENVLVFYETLAIYVPQMVKGTPYKTQSKSVGDTFQDKTVAGWLTINNGERYPTSILDFDNDIGLHPTQKPVALFEYLIRTYTQPGDVVLDFVCGSGTTCVAAQNTQRQFIGGDSHLPYVEIARHRLATSTLPLPMFEAS